MVCLMNREILRESPLNPKSCAPWDALAAGNDSLALYLLTRYAENYHAVMESRFAAARRFVLAVGGRIWR
jgi:hypothetical protein